ncbi:hypothetical protein Rs2_15775 [Raphanus sativus]|nr:hypothetical protein Rs2_15775 [Raphanus sativus]
MEKQNRRVRHTFSCVAIGGIGRRWSPLWWDWPSLVVSLGCVAEGKMEEKGKWGRIGGMVWEMEKGNWYNSVFGRPVGKTDNERLRVRRRRGGLVYNIHGHSGDMIPIRILGVDLISILGKTNRIKKFMAYTEIL